MKRNSKHYPPSFLILSTMIYNNYLFGALTKFGEFDITVKCRPTQNQTLLKVSEKIQGQLNLIDCLHTTYIAHVFYGNFPELETAHNGPGNIQRHKLVC